MVEIHGTNAAGQPFTTYIADKGSIPDALYQTTLQQVAAMNGMTVAQLEAAIASPEAIHTPIPAVAPAIVPTPTPTPLPAPAGTPTPTAAAVPSTFSNWFDGSTEVMGQVIPNKLLAIGGVFTLLFFFGGGGGGGKKGTF